MSQLTTLLRSLGNQGAVTNARRVIESREREDWVVEGLSRRLEPAGPPAVRPAVRPALPARVA